MPEGDYIRNFIKKRSVDFILEKRGVETVSHGFVSHGPPTILNVRGSIQDANLIDMKDMPEGFHNRSVLSVNVLKDVDLVTDDIVEYLGERYEVHSVENKRITHNEALVVGKVNAN